MHRAGIGIAACSAAMWGAFFIPSSHPAPALQPADAIRGQAVFGALCTGCHSLDRDDEGPRLRGVYGRTSGTVPRFPYSDALRQAHIVWNQKSLEKWLAEPDRLVPGSGMPVSISDLQKRRDVIAYLKANSK